MKQLTGTLALLIIGYTLSAQAPQDRDIIDKLCGCFEVSFKYAETFAPSADYKFHDREEIGGTAELALPIEISDKKIVIQHLLVVTPTVVVKHWREEWTYENPVIWRYKGDRTWVKETLPADQVKGKWTQTVWEVADEPRYQGYSQFVNLDGKIIWQNTTDAPLPRREYTVRDDYNVLKRTNRMNITDNGYVHEQDNQKILRGNGTDQLLVEEKGLNVYKKIDDKECAAAKDYWEKNQDYWGRVRKIWADYIATHDVISLKNKVDGKLLHEYLLAQARDFLAKKISPAEIDAKIKEEISRFIGQDEKKVALK
jgi:hypothetical protein